MENNSREPSKLDRKEVEKKRRIEMKNLCLNLISLIPSHLFNPTISNKVLIMLFSSVNLIIKEFMPIWVNNFFTKFLLVLSLIYNSHYN